MQNKTVLTNTGKKYHKFTIAYFWNSPSTYHQQ